MMLLLDRSSLIRTKTERERRSVPDQFAAVSFACAALTAYCRVHVFSLCTGYKRQRVFHAVEATRTV